MAKHAYQARMTFQMTALAFFALWYTGSMATAQELKDRTRYSDRANVVRVAEISAIFKGDGTTARTFYVADGSVPDHPNAGDFLLGLDLTLPAQELSSRGRIFGQETQFSPGKLKADIKPASGVGPYLRDIASTVQTDGSQAAGNYTLSLKGGPASKRVHLGDRICVGNSTKCHVVLDTALSDSSGDITVDIWPKVPDAGYSGDETVRDLGSWESGLVGNIDHRRNSPNAVFQAYSPRSLSVYFVGNWRENGVLHNVAWSDKGNLIGFAEVSSVSDSIKSGWDLELQPPGKNLGKPVSKNLKGYGLAQLMPDTLSARSGAMTATAGRWAPTGPFFLMGRYHLGAKYRDSTANQFLIDRTVYRLALRPFSVNRARFITSFGGASFTAESPEFTQLERWIFVFAQYDDTNTRIRCGWSFDTARTPEELKWGSWTTVSGALDTSTDDMVFNDAVGAGNQFVGLAHDQMGIAGLVEERDVIRLQQGPIPSPTTETNLVWYIGDYEFSGANLTTGLDLGPSRNQVGSPTSIYNVTFTNTLVGHSLQGGSALAGAPGRKSLGVVTNEELLNVGAGEAVGSTFRIYGTGDNPVQNMDEIFLDAQGLAAADITYVETLLELFAADPAALEAVVHNLSGTVRTGAVAQVSWSGLGFPHPSRYAFDWSGATDTADAGTSWNSTLRSDFTVEGWFFANPPADEEQFVLSNRGVSGGEATIQVITTLVSDGIEVKAILGLAAFNLQVAETAVLTPAPIHFAVAVDYDTDSTITLYLNGILAATASNASGVGSLSAENLNVGSSSVPDGYLTGRITEIRLWSEARTEAQIQDNMFEVIADPSSESTLVSYYTSNDLLNPSTWSDSKGSNDITITGPTRSTGTTIGSLQGLVKYYATVPGSADADKVDLSEAWALPTTPLYGGPPVAFERTSIDQDGQTELTGVEDIDHRATAQDRIDFIRMSHAAALIYDPAAGTLILRPIRKPTDGSEVATFTASDFRTVPDLVSGVPPHFLSVGYAPSSLTQPGIINVNAEPGHLAFVSRPLRQLPQVAFGSNVDNYPFGAAEFTLPTALIEESAAVATQDHIVAFYGEGDAYYPFEANSLWELATPGQSVKLRSPFVDGGEILGVVVAVKPSGRYYTYQVRRHLS